MIFSWNKSNKLKLPAELKGHEFTNLIGIATERPVNINKIQNKIQNTNISPCKYRDTHVFYTDSSINCISSALIPNLL